MRFNLRLCLSLLLWFWFLAYQVYIHIPGAKKLMLELPLVIGTVPYNGFGSRNSSVASQFIMDMSWLTLTLPDQLEAPPNYEDVAWEEEFSRHTSYLQPPVRGSHAVLCLPSLRNQILDSASLFRGKFTSQRCRRDPACFLHSLNIFRNHCVNHQIRTLVLYPCPFEEEGGKMSLRI